MGYMNWVIKRSLIKGLLTKVWAGFGEMKKGRGSTPDLATLGGHYQY